MSDICTNYLLFLSRSGAVDEAYLNFHKLFCIFLVSVFEIASEVLLEVLKVRTICAHLSFNTRILRNSIESSGQRQRR